MTVGMKATNPFREQAEECLRLAEEADDAWVRKALEELALRLVEAAKEIERDGPSG
jgi:hypothetical protein